MPLSAGMEELPGGEKGKGTTEKKGGREGEKVSAAHNILTINWQRCTYRERGEFSGKKRETGSFAGTSMIGPCLRVLTYVGKEKRRESGGKRGEGKEGGIHDVEIRGPCCDSPGHDRVEKGGGGGERKKKMVARCASLISYLYANPRAVGWKREKGKKKINPQRRKRGGKGGGGKRADSGSRFPGA